MIYDWDNRILVNNSFLQGLSEKETVSLELKNIGVKVKENITTWYEVISNPKFETIPEILEIKNKEFFRLSDELIYSPKPN